MVGSLGQIGNLGFAESFEKEKEILLGELISFKEWTNQGAPLLQLALLRLDTLGSLPDSVT